MGALFFLVLGLPAGFFGLYMQIVLLDLQLLHAPLPDMQRTLREWQLSQASRWLRLLVGSTDMLYLEIEERPVCQSNLQRPSSVYIIARQGEYVQ